MANIPTKQREGEAMNRSETIGALAKALSAMQAEMPAAVKAKENPYFKSRYADLAAVWDVVRAPLAKHDLSIMQLAETVEIGGKIGARVTTLLAHSSGEFVCGEMTLVPKVPDPQGMGSAVTYARRYGLASIVGVVAQDEDDDGNYANGRGAPQHPDNIPATDDRMSGDQPMKYRRGHKPKGLPETFDDTAQYADPEPQEGDFIS